MKHQTLVATKPTNQTRTSGDELAWIAAEQRQHIEDDLAAEREYQAWKKANGLGNLDRMGYEALFDPNCIAR